MAVLIPVMVTNAVFEQAEKNGANWVSSWNKGNK
jgi:hypothetical protein